MPGPNSASLRGTQAPRSPWKSAARLGSASVPPFYALSLFSDAAQLLGADGYTELLPTQALVSLTHRRHQHLYLLPGSGIRAPSPDTKGVHESRSTLSILSGTRSPLSLFIWVLGRCFTSFWDTQLPQKTVAGGAAGIRRAASPRQTHPVP